MDTIEKKLDAIMNYLVAQSPEDRMQAFEQLQDMAPCQTQSASLEEIIDKELVELGVPCHILGHGHLAKAIEIAVRDPEAMHAMVKVMYAKVAKVYHSTPSRVERGIRHAIECCWDRGDWDTLHDYFGNTVSPNKGKPTNSEFIARVAAVIRRKMA